MNLPATETALPFASVISAAVLDIFATLIPLDVEVGEAVLGTETLVQADLISMIGLAGSFKGLLAVQCPEPVALAMGGAMLGLPLDSMDQDVRDGVGEVANMVAGSLKNYLGEQGIGTQITVPTTVVGRNIRSSRVSGGTRIESVFRIQAGRFSVELKYILKQENRASSVRQ